MSRPRIHRIEERHPQIVSDGQRRERAWKLKAARHAAAGTLVGQQPVDCLAVEAHAAGFIYERPANAVHQGRFAGAVGTDQADAFALGDGEVDAIECDKAAETFAHSGDLEQRASHHFVLPRVQPCTRPTMPFGAITTNATSSNPTMRRLTAEEMVRSEEHTSELQSPD